MTIQPTQYVSYNRGLTGLCRRRWPVQVEGRIVLVHPRGSIRHRFPKGIKSQQPAMHKVQGYQTRHYTQMILRMRLQDRVELRLGSKEPTTVAGIGHAQGFASRIVPTPAHAVLLPIFLSKSSTPRCAMLLFSQASTALLCFVLRYSPIPSTPPCHTVQYPLFIHHCTGLLTTPLIPAFTLRSCSPSSPFSRVSETEHAPMSI